MFGRQRHAETEIGADMIGIALAETAQHLDNRQALSPHVVDDRRVGAFGRREKQTVNAVFPHAGDEAVLPDRRLGCVGEEGNPAGAIETILDAGGQLGIKRIGDLAHDQTDRLGQPGAQIGRGAVVDIAERIERGPERVRASRMRPADCCESQAIPSPAKRQRASQCLSTWSCRSRQGSLPIVLRSIQHRLAVSAFFEQLAGQILLDRSKICGCRRCESKRLGIRR